MSRLRCAVRLAAIAALIGLSPWASSAIAPSAADLARCAGIAAPDARLACYDTLAGRSLDRSVQGAVATPAASTLGATASGGPTSSTASTSANSTAPKNFGLTQAQIHTAPEGPAAIQARIAKIIDNRVARAYVVLDNGQTWTLTDSGEDLRLGTGDLVTITRASLGSFLMVTQSKRSYHVRRMR